MRAVELDLRRSVGTGRRRRGPGRTAALLAADACALAVGTLALPRTVAAAFAAVALVVLASRGGYARRFSTVNGRTAKAAAAALAFPALAGSAVLPAHDAQALVRAAPLCFVLLVAARWVVGRAVEAVRLRRSGGQPTLIVGAGSLGVRIANHLLHNPQLGLAPVGFLDRVDDDDLPLPVLGDCADLATIARLTDAHQVIVAYGQVRESEMVGIMRASSEVDADVWVVPRFFELGLNGPRAVSDDLWGIPVTKAPRLALRSGQWRLKRVFDVVVAGTTLLFLTPVMAIIALAVKLTSPGPIFFKQQRVGQGGRIVEILKFRTLKVNDDSNTTWDVTADDRVTSIGRILRPTSLDEMPQLINVLRGDMSLVGPRPERPFFVAEFSRTVARYDDRHRVPAGVTGLAQVNGLRGDTSIEERARFDNAYIENWSLWSDIVILLRTVRAVIRPPRSVRVQRVADVAPIIDLRDDRGAGAPTGDIASSRTGA